jgi:hypothetical protein
MDIGESGWRGIDWISLAQDRHKWRILVNVVMNLRVLQNAGELSIDLSDLSSSAKLHLVSLSKHFWQ